VNQAILAWFTSTRDISSKYHEGEVEEEKSEEAEA